MRQEIENAVKVLRGGGVIIYPTDTVWGLGCDATNIKAIRRIYRIKKRVSSKTMVILVSSVDMIKDYVEEVPDIAYDLLSNIDKPLTIIYKNARNLPKSLIAKDGSIGIRVTKDEFSQRLVTALGNPVISTSANLSGELTPLYFKMIPKDIIDKADYVVNLYRDSINEVKPSTIIRFDNDIDFSIIRE